MTTSTCNLRWNSRTTAHYCELPEGHEGDHECLCGEKVANE